MEYINIYLLLYYFPEGQLVIVLVTVEYTVLWEVSFLGTDLLQRNAVKMP